MVFADVILPGHAAGRESRGAGSQLPARRDDGVRHLSIPVPISVLLMCARAAWGKHPVLHSLT